MRSDPFDIPLSELRRRRSAKWTQAPADSLPLWVAEMDVRLAPAVVGRLHEAIELSDTGYAGDPLPAAAAFAGFAARRWGWSLDPARCVPFPDLARSGSAVLSQLTGDDRRVVFNPPVYSSFYAWLEIAGLVPVEVPLLAPETGGRLDLDGIDAALRDGVRAVLLCSPHNPTGSLRTRDELAALAELAAAHDAWIVADEIHSPLTYPGGEFVPFLTVSDAARRVGVALHSASKAWNLAGLKASFAVTAEGGPCVPTDAETMWNPGLFGLLAAEAAFTGGDDWLDDVVHQLQLRAAHIGERLAAELPDAGYTAPRAGFLAWLDLRQVFGEDPAAVIQQRCGLTLSAGHSFGQVGRGWARLNFATSMTILDDALDRIVAAAAA